MSSDAPLRSVLVMVTQIPQTQPQTQTPPRASRFARARNLPLAVAARVLLTMLAMMGASFGASVGASVVLGSFAETPAGSMTVFVVVCLAGTLFAWLLRRFFEGDRAGHLAARWNGGRALGSFGIGLLAAVLALGSTWAIALLSGAASIRSAPPIPLSEWVTSIMLIIGVSVFLQGIPEEMLWRGYFQTTVTERLRPWTAAVIGAVGFGSMHVVSIGSGGTWASKLIYILMAIGLGLACAGLRVLTGSVWAAAGFHGGMHIVNRTLPNWVSGDQGQTLIAVSGVMMGLVFVACWLIYRAGRGSGSTSTRRDASIH